MRGLFELCQLFISRSTGNQRSRRRRSRGGLTAPFRRRRTSTAKQKPAEGVTDPRWRSPDRVMEHDDSRVQKRETDERLRRCTQPCRSAKSSEPAYNNSALAMILSQPFHQIAAKGRSEKDKNTKREFYKVPLGTRLRRSARSVSYTYMYLPHHQRGRRTLTRPRGRITLTHLSGSFVVRDPASPFLSGCGEDVVSPAEDPGVHESDFDGADIPQPTRWFSW